MIHLWLCGELKHSVLFVHWNTEVEQRSGISTRTTMNSWQMRTLARVKGGSDHFVLFFASLQLNPGYIFTATKDWSFPNHHTWWMQNAVGVLVSPSPIRCGLPEEGSNCGWFSSSSASGQHKKNLIRLAPQSWYLKKCSHKNKAYEILAWNQTQTSFDPLWQSNSVNMQNS